MEIDSRSIRGALVGAVVLMGMVRVIFPHLGRSTGERQLFDAIAILAGAGLIVFGFVVLRRKRLLENVPTSRIRSVAMGFAELIGSARSRTPLVAPYSGIPCVFYRSLLEEERQRSRGGREWVTLEQGTSTDPFYLQDETGALLVDPAGAETVLERSYRQVERGEGWLGRRKRYSEWWIVAGQKLFVAGTVTTLRNAVLERRAVLGDRLREIKHDPEKMKLIDADHDGTISEQEWGNAVRAMQNVLVREDAAAPAGPAEETIAIGKGSDETTFAIAARGEKSLLLRLRLEVAGGLLGGTVIVVVFTISFLSRAGVLPGGFVFPW